MIKGSSCFPQFPCSCYYTISSLLLLRLVLYIITSKPAQEDVIITLQAAVCRPLTLPHCCVDIHRRSQTRGLQCGAVRLPGGAPADRLQRRQLRPRHVFCHRRHRFHTWREPAESDWCCVRTQCAETLEDIRTKPAESEYAEGHIWCFLISVSVEKSIHNYLRSI